MADLADCDLVIEAVVEHLDLKRQIFSELDQIVRDDAVLATNTSSLSVTEISAATTDPHRVVGMHFFNPAPVLKLVEVIRTVVTEPDVVEDVHGACPRLGKNPVVAGDKAGFIANALLFGYLNHAVVDVREPLRHPRGHRRGDAARLRLPDGPAGAARPDRPGHRVRDPRHDVPAGPRPAARAGSDPQADGHGRACWAARPGAASTPTTGPDSPGRRRRRADPASAPHDPTTPRPVRRVGVVGSGTMATGIVEVFAKAGFDVTFVARSDEKVARVGRDRRPRSLDKAVQRGKLEQRRPRRGSRRGSPVSTRLDDLADVDLVVEAIAEELLASSRRCSRTSTRSAAPARSWPPPRRRCR